MRPSSPICALLLSTIAALAIAGPAAAHPHVWVTMHATVLYDDKSIAGLQQAWTFDEFYTQQAIEGLDKNGDGKYDRTELQELAQVNVDGLKEFDYFTYARLDETPLKFKPPTDYWLDYSDKGILTLHFTLPLEQPVAADARGFNFAIYDSSYFIAFDFAEQDAVKLSTHAPAGCRAAIHEPAEDAETKRLTDAFAKALGPEQGTQQQQTQPDAGGPMSTSGSVDFGAGGKTVAVECAKS